MDEGFEACDALAVAPFLLAKFAQVVDENRNSGVIRCTAGDRGSPFELALEVGTAKIDAIDHKPCCCAAVPYNHYLLDQGVE